MTDQDAKCRKNGHIDLWGSFQTVEPSPWLSLLSCLDPNSWPSKMVGQLENLSLSSMILRTKPPFCEGKKPSAIVVVAFFATHPVSKDLSPGIMTADQVSGSLSPSPTWPLAATSHCPVIVTQASEPSQLIHAGCLFNDMLCWAKSWDWDDCAISR